MVSNNSFVQRQVHGVVTPRWRNSISDCTGSGQQKKPNNNNATAVLMKATISNFAPKESKCYELKVSCELVCYTLQLRESIAVTQTALPTANYLL